MNVIVKFLRRIKSLIRGVYFPYNGFVKGRNYIFIHIPKVAGTSILHSLNLSSGSRKHLPWYVYYSANPDYFKSAFKFAFVRNPWARTFSAYSYLKSGGNGAEDTHVSKLVNNYSSFDEFVVSGLGEGHFRSHLLFLPQSNFVVNGRGEIAVDFIGRFEFLERDFAYVSERVGGSHSLSKENMSNISGFCYKDFYRSEKSIEVIREIYKQDVLLFGYGFN